MKKNGIDLNRSDFCTLDTMIDFLWKKLRPIGEGTKFALSVLTQTQEAFPKIKTHRLGPGLEPGPLDL